MRLHAAAYPPYLWYLQGTDLIEEYVYNFSYGVDGALALDVEMVKGKGADKKAKKGREDKSKGKEKVRGIPTWTVNSARASGKHMDIVSNAACPTCRSLSTRSASRSRD